MASKNELEKRVKELERKVRDLESRPIYIPVQIPVNPAPYSTPCPTIPPYNPLGPTIICGTPNGEPHNGNLSRS